MTNEGATTSNTDGQIKNNRNAAAGHSDATPNETEFKKMNVDEDGDTIGSKNSKNNSSSALVTKSMISSNGSGSTADAENDTTGFRRKKNSLERGINNVKAFMRDSTHFSEITMKQIDRIRMMHDRFEEGSQFSFNYNTLLVVASILAGLGLVSDNSTTVIASMLISPIMGPVVGIAYGATIRDWRLCRIALQTELLSLIVCIVVGALLGIICGSTHLSDEWPNQEMKSRAMPQNLYVALPVAFVSGLGVAVSLLDEQTSSLVGVAISASLLPPAVNAGILWVCYGIYVENNQDQEEETQGGDDNDGNEYYSQYYEYNTKQVGDSGYERQQFRHAGFISLGLTVANVVLIIIASMLMFRLKERLPIKKKIFWTDLGVARKVYRNLAFLSSSDHSKETDNISLQGDVASQTNDIDVDEASRYVAAAS